MKARAQFTLFLLINSLLLLLCWLNNLAFLHGNLASLGNTLPWHTYYLLLKTILAHGLLIITISGLNTGLANQLIRRWQLDPERAVVISFSLVMGLVFLLNQLYYPQSAYANLSQSLIPNPLATVLVLIATLFLLFTVLNRTTATVIGIIALGFAFYPTPSPWLQHSTKKNVILIGVDSLRLEQLEKTPTLDKAIHSGQQFTHAITPLARTYPAWLSILTGLYPIHHGAQFNLMLAKPEVPQQSIATILKKHNYETLFATDERRFSPIDERLGFTQVVAPKTGVNDFLQGRMNDIPWLNLFSNTVIGRTLFPYNYMNRASFVHYKPETFNQEIETGLDKLNPGKPLFMAVHFTLPHWPLVYGDSPTWQIEKPETLYDSALAATDVQVKQLLNSLRKRGLLNHALVVFLSDHGDAPFNENGRLTRENHYQPPKTQAFKQLMAKQGLGLSESFGHGTDVLTPSQLHVALSLHFYPEDNASTHRQAVSLIDLKPTILDSLSLNDKSISDGTSLMPIINGGTLKPRTLYSETGIHTERSLYDKSAMAKAAKLGLQLYRINPRDDHLWLKNSAIAKLINDKQYVAINQDTTLALYPNPDSDSPFLAVIVDNHTGAWSDVLSSPFSQKHQALVLKNQLAQLYHQDF